MPLAKIDLNPDRSKLRQFGLATVVVAFVLSLIGIWRGSVLGMTWDGLSSAPAIVFGAIGGLSLLFSLLEPRGNKPLFLLLTIVTFPIGLVLSMAVMILFYYLLITPIALFFRLIGRDRLDRSWDKAASSYWKEKPEQNDAARYLRQF